MPDNMISIRDTGIRLDEKDARDMMEMYRSEAWANHWRAVIVLRDKEVDRVMGDFELAAPVNYHRAQGQYQHVDRVAQIPVELEQDLAALDAAKKKDQ